VFENMGLGRIFGLKRDKVRGERKYYITESFKMYNIAQYYLGDQIDTNEMGGACGTYGGETRTGFRWETLGKHTTLKAQTLMGG
jgi:hypothetical protein